MRPGRPLIPGNVIALAAILISADFINGVAIGNRQMPRIFDNIELQLLPTLQKAMEVSQRADFCVGYFNLRGWRHLDQYVDPWSGTDGHCCRLLVGMHRPDETELLRAAANPAASDEMDNPGAARLRKKLAESFRDQLTLGAPTDLTPQIICSLGLRHA